MSEQIREQHDRNTNRVLSDIVALCTDAQVFVNGGDRCLAEQSILEAQRMLKLAYESNVDAYKTTDRTDRHPCGCPYPGDQPDDEQICLKHNTTECPRCLEHTASSFDPDGNEYCSSCKQPKSTIDR